jgi:replicative DNA helicase
MNQTVAHMAHDSHSHFAQYGKQFQEKIFQGLLSDHNWSTQMVEVMSPSFFDVKYLAYLTEKYFAYFQKYKTFPTLPLLITIIKDDLSHGNDVILRDQIVEFLHRIKHNPDMGDIAYVKDKSLDFCKRQAFKEALEQAVELISTDKFDSVVDLMKTAVAVGMPSSVGHDFFEDAEARFLKISRQVCPTGIDRLDANDILQGGLGRGELGVITANTGVGKSHYLVQMGANAMRAGKNVVHYTFELSELAVGRRYDSNLCGIASNEVIDNKAHVLERYNDKELGRLIIKEYPTGSASVITIRNHIEKLTLKGFRPNVVIIDYADIMRSTRSYDSLRHELKLIYEELRNMSMEMGVPVWTASQANRDSASSDIVGLENMSEAYGKAMVADVVISISRKPMEKSTGAGRLFVAKNRVGRDGLLFPIHIDTSMSIIEILDESALTLAEATEQDDNAMKDLLKRKWKEVSKI